MKTPMQEAIEKLTRYEPGHEPGLMETDQRGDYLRFIDVMEALAPASPASVPVAPDLISACRELIAYVDANPPMADSLWCVQKIRAALTSKVTPTAWALLAECDPQATIDPELADYWKRKGRTVTALYAAPLPPVVARKVLDDAERYRWMRRTFVSDDDCWPDDVADAKTGEELDTAIDAARLPGTSGSGVGHEP